MILRGIFPRSWDFESPGLDCGQGRVGQDLPPFVQFPVTGENAHIDLFGDGILHPPLAVNEYTQINRPRDPCFYRRLRISWIDTHYALDAFARPGTVSA